MSYVHPTQCLSINSTSKPLVFNINKYWNKCNKNIKREIDDNGVEDTGPIYIFIYIYIYIRQEIKAKYNDIMQVMQVMNYAPLLIVKVLKPIRVIDWFSN